MSLYGIDLLSSILNDEDGLYAFTRLGLKEDYFQGDEAYLFNYIKDHVSKYKKLPDTDTVESTEIWDEEGETKGSIQLSNTPEPISYYYDKVIDRYTSNTLRNAITAASHKFGEKDNTKCVSILRDCLLKINLLKNKRKIVDYSEFGFDVVNEYFLKTLNGGPDTSMFLGWPSFDKLCGGLVGGDVVSFIGRPAAGKSYQLLYSALNMWDKGFRPLFFSMEMKPISIIQRLTAMDAKIPVTGLKKAELSDISKKNMFEKLESNKNKHPFWIVDGALSATLDDIEMLAVQLQPDVVFIDGAYLIRHESKNQRWERLTYIAEGIKQRIAEDLDMPVIISYQFNRGADKKGADATLADIAYTDSIGQLSSVVLGILEEESIETSNSRKIKVLKGRDGQVGEFKINWNFDNGPNFMDFTEIEDEYGDFM